MSERKVLNKYYPPDFDPSKIPKLKQGKTRQYTIRTMAPFNMRCNTCGDYIYKGRKFNAKCETAEDDNYLGLRIYRFYIRCPKCITEIMFKTDLENTDYTLEHGATRLFEAQKLLEVAEKKEQKRLEEDSTNPMKMLENRTKDSKLEMEIMENLEELRELNTRQADLDYTEILRVKAEEAENALRRQEEEDEAEIRRLFGKSNEKVIKRLNEDSDSDEEIARSSSSSERNNKRASDFLVEESEVPKKSKLSTKSTLAGLVKTKKSSTRNSEGITNVDQGTSDLVEQTLTTIDKVGHSNSHASQQSTHTTEHQSRVDDVGDDVKNEGQTKEKGEENIPDPLFDENTFENSIMEGMARTAASLHKPEKVKAANFGLVGYDESDSDESS